MAASPETLAPDPAGDAPALRHLRILISALCALLLVWKFALLSRINVSWDEFVFLSSVHDLGRGTLASGFQTFYVRLFGWVRFVSGNEVDQVIAAREAMFLVRLATCAVLFALGRLLAGRLGAWVALLLSLAFPYLLRHGESFRADPLLGLLFLAAAALLFWRPASGRAILAAAALTALALAVSVKAVVFLPTLGALLLVPALAGANERGAWRRMLVFAAAAAALAAALVLLHIASLKEGAATVTLRSIALLGWRMLEPPPMDVLLLTLRRDWMCWLPIAAGAVLAIHAVAGTAGAARARALAVLAMLLPLSTLAFYRNSYPYYYVAIVPGACLAAGYALHWNLARFAPSRVAAVAALLLLPVAAQAVVSLRALNADMTTGQRTLIDTVHALYPEPVPYIDRCGMIASFPKAGPLMSTLVLSRYRKAGQPIMPGLLRSRRPVFVLGNVPGLQLGGDWVATEPHRLLQEDFEYLRANYLPHWGPLWVAGKAVEARVDQATAFELSVPGPYTVEAAGAVLLDRERVAAGAVVTLAAGAHTLQAVARDGEVRLRHGDHLPVPPPPADRRPLVIFTGL